MRIKTLLLITLIFLLTSSIPWGNIDLLRIQSFPLNSNTLVQKATNSKVWKSANPKLSRRNNTVDLINTPAIVKASEVGLIVGNYSGIIDQVPALSITKTANPLTYDQPGQVITYTYLVTNTGDVSLLGPVVVIDDKADDEACPPVNSVGNQDDFLDPGESLTCGASYTIVLDDMSAGSVTNIASASADGTDSPTDTATVTAVPALAIAKTADPLTYSQLGQVITYTYIVSNPGYFSLYGQVTVSDDKAADESCPSVNSIGNHDRYLDPGEELTCTATYTITQADLDAGSVTNIATATIAGITSPPDSATVTIVQVPALDLAKNADPLTYDQPGQVISYTYLVTNTGALSLLGPVTVDDDKATNETCPPVSSVGNGDDYLDPAENLTCSASYTIAQGDLDAGSVTNIASASADGTTSPADTATVTAVQTPALSIFKTAEPLTYDQTGQVITYTYSVTNSGNITLYDITVLDDKTVVTCPDTSGGLSPLSDISCTATYTITQEDLNAGSVTNTAYATDGSTQSDTDSATITAVQTPALAITKTANPLTYDHNGQLITYTFLVTNTGNITLYNITVLDDKTATTCPDTSEGLDPSNEITCTAAYTITQEDLNVGSVTNTAYATDGSTQSDPDSATVTASQSPALDLAKSANPQIYDQPGQVISYTYLVTNNGNVSLLGPVTVSDDKADDEACPSVGTVGNHDDYLDPAENLTCSASYTITQADMDAGSVTNIASASADGTTSPTDTVTVTAIQDHALSLSKTADPLTYNQPGQVISYTFLISNTGNLRLLGPVAVSDDKANDETCPPVSSVGNEDDYLDPGENLTCNASYTITQADIEAGSVTNIASASADGTTSPTDTATVTAVQTPALIITKSADPHTYDQPGQVITYTYLVSNTGNVIIHSPFEVLDDKTDNESCPTSPTSLDPGQSILCSSSYIIQNEDITHGYVTNAAYATGMFNDNTIQSNTDTETVTAVNIVRFTYLPSVTKSQPGVRMLPNSYSYVSHNNQFIIGEISNNTKSTLTWVDIVVNFYDSNGGKIGSSHAYLWPLNLPAWERGCFKISSDILSWSYYVLSAPSYTTVNASPGLAILTTSGIYDPTYGDYDITGQVRNNSTLLSKNVGVSGTLYNISGQPVGCDYNYINGKDLNPGQTSSFTINFLGYFRNYYDVTNYKLRVSGELP